MNKLSIALQERQSVLAAISIAFRGTTSAEGPCLSHFVLTTPAAVRWINLQPSQWETKLAISLQRTDVVVFEALLRALDEPLGKQGAWQDHVVVTGNERLNPTPEDLPRLAGLMRQAVLASTASRLVINFCARDLGLLLGFSSDWVLIPPNASPILSAVVRPMCENWQGLSDRLSYHWWTVAVPTLWPGIAIPEYDEEISQPRTFECSKNEAQELLDALGHFCGALFEDDPRAYEALATRGAFRATCGEFVELMQHVESVRRGGCSDDH